MSPSSIALVAICLLSVSGRSFAQDEEPLPEGNAFVKNALNSARPQDAAINDYSYDLVEARENLDDKGRVKSREVLGYEVYFVETRPIRRLVSKNGVALNPKEQAKEDERARTLARAIAEGRTVSEQPVRIRLSAIVESSEIKTVGREERRGRKTLVFDFAPRESGAASGARAASGFDAVARLLTGRLHLDEADRRVVLLEARTVPGQKASVATGVKLGVIELSMEFEQITDGIWLPRQVVSVVSGRAYWFKTFRVRQTTTYSNYRKFQVDTEEEKVR